MGQQNRIDGKPVSAPFLFYPEVAVKKCILAKHILGFHRIYEICNLEFPLFYINLAIKKCHSGRSVAESRNP